MTTMLIEKLGVPLSLETHYEAMAACPYQTSDCGKSRCGVSCYLTDKSTYCPKHDQTPDPATFEAEMEQKL